jgi:hypothetical protein
VHCCLLLKLFRCKYEQLDTLLFVQQSLYGLLVFYCDILEAKSRFVYWALCFVHFTVVPCTFIGEHSLPSEILLTPTALKISTPASIVDVWLFLTPLRMLGAQSPPRLLASVYTVQLAQLQL